LWNNEADGPGYVNGWAIGPESHEQTWQNASQRCLSGLNGKTQNDSRFNQDLQKRLSNNSRIRPIESVAATLPARRRASRQTPHRQSHHACLNTTARPALKPVEAQ